MYKCKGKITERISNILQFSIRTLEFTSTFVFPTSAKEAAKMHNYHEFLTEWVPSNSSGWKDCERQICRN